MNDTDRGDSTYLATMEILEQRETWLEWGMIGVAALFVWGTNISLDRQEVNATDPVWYLLAAFVFLLAYEALWAVWVDRPRALTAAVSATPHRVDHKDSSGSSRLAVASQQHMNTCPVNAREQSPHLG